MKNITLICCIFTIFITTNVNAEYMNVQDVLITIGKKFDAYFVVESYEESGKSDSNILTLYVSDSIIEVESLDEFINVVNSGENITFLNKDKKKVQSPSISFVNKKLNILRVNDKKIDNVEKYVLEELVSIEYSGNPVGLVIELGKSSSGLLARSQNNNLSVKRNFDFNSKIESSFKDEKIRNILSESIPLKKYNRIIWSSEYFENSDEVAIIYFGEK